MTAPQLEAEALRELRVPFLAGVPGSGPSYELLDACERAGVWFLPTAHEAAGAIIAGAAARQQQGFGAALSIKGPGVANLLAGIALAGFENYRLLTFSESYAPNAPAGLQHKRMPQDAALSALVKGVFYRSGHAVTSMAALAAAEPAGPVHLNLVEGPERSTDRVAAVSPGCRLDQLLDRIQRAQRPVLICGSVLTRLSPATVTGPVCPPLTLPVFTTAAAKGVIDESATCSAGVYTGAGGELTAERALMAKADLIVGLGLRNSEVLGARPFSAPYVSIDALGPACQAGFDPALHAVVDLLDALPSIFGALKGHAWGLDDLIGLRAAMAGWLETDGLLPAPMYQRLQRVPGVRLVTDSGNFTIVAEHVWRSSAPSEFVGSSNGRFMGAALPQAIGVALHDRTRPVVCSVGDGGLPPFIAELRIAIERRLPLLVVLMTDGYYGSMRAKVLERNFTDVGVRVVRSSWERTAAAMGCPAVRVSTLSDFDATVTQWRPASGPLFVEAAMPDLPYLEMVRPLR